MHYTIRLFDGAAVREMFFRDRGTAELTFNALVLAKYEPELWQGSEKLR